MMLSMNRSWSSELDEKAALESELRRDWGEVIFHKRLIVLGEDIKTVLTFEDLWSALVTHHRLRSI